MESRILRPCLWKHKQGLSYYKPEDKKLREEEKEIKELRNRARKEKNWAESDRLRDELISKGYIVKDTKEGTVVE